MQLKVSEREMWSSGLDRTWASPCLAGTAGTTLAGITRATHTCAHTAVPLAIFSALAFWTTVAVF